jgi:hypothetical protein
MDINGFIIQDMTGAIDRGRLWLEDHFRVCQNFFILESIA